VPRKVGGGRPDQAYGERGEYGRERSVVGFGADTPAFLLRAAPSASLSKTEAAED
jgi:hypothetical protein